MLFLISGNLWAQSEKAIEKIAKETKVEKLKKQGIKHKKEALREKQEAVEMAKKKGWIIRKEFKNGGVMEIQRIEDGKPIYYITHNIDAAYTISTNEVWSGGDAGLNLSGSGLMAGVWDGGAVRVSHQEFEDRVSKGDGASSLSDHATHVTGTVCAAGITTDAKGMAYEANVKAYNWTSDYGEMSVAASDDGLLLSNHSYGIPAGYSWNGSNWTWYGDESISSEEDYSFGFYNNECSYWDQLAFDAPYYLMVISAGNDRGEGPDDGSYPQDGAADGGYDCIAGKALAKNVLAVGATYDLISGYTGNPSEVGLTSFSSTGPADDGRVKPDISANGYQLYSTTSSGDDSYGAQSGTSMSSPSATGSLLLLQEHYENVNGENTYMKSATLKGLVIHTADEAGANPGPDYRFGWGLMNTEKAAEVISEMNQKSFILEETLVENNTYKLLVYSEGNSPLNLTMAWTDPAGTPVSPQLDPTTPMLVNDLDVTIESPSGTVHYPYYLDPANPSAAAQTGVNDVDNVEKIEIDSPEAGIYEVTITHKGSSLENNQQDFSLIISDIIANSPGNFGATALGTTETKLTWDKNVNQDDVMLVSSLDELAGSPTQGNSYVAGDSIGNGEVIYIGPDTSFVHEFLQSGTYYYYTAWSVDESNNFSAPVEASVQTEYDVIFSDGFETDKGWNIIDEFEISMPQGLGGSEGNPDPNSAYEGMKVLGSDLTGLGGSGGNPEGDYAGALNDREYQAESPVINCEYYSEVNLHFQRWLNVENPEFDTVQIDVSADGGTTWQNIWYNSKEYTESSWNKQTLDISSYVDDSSQVQVRYTVGETDFGGFYSGWNIDNFKITGKIPRYSLTYLVKDGSDNPIANAYIEMNGKSGMTNSSGYLTINGVKKSKDVPYTVRKENFNNYTGTYDVINDNDTVEVIMSAGTATFEVEFTVMDGDVPVSGASVDFNSQNKTTNTSAVATFTGVEVGNNLSYMVTKDTITETGSVDVVDRNVEDTVYFTYEVSFYVKDTDNSPIDNATVSLNGYGDSTTNVNGAVTYNDVVAEENLSYTVTATDYSQKSGTINVSANTAETVQLLPKGNSVTFNVDNGTDPLENVKIQIDNRILYTDAGGTASFDTTEGTYNYTMIKDHYYQETGTINVADQDITENVTMNRANQVEFSVTGDNGSIGNALVDMGSESYYTDANGIVAFDTINGDYIYTVSKDGYNEESGDFTVMNKDTTLNISLTEVVGIEDPDSWNLSVYPNPTNGLIYIEGKDLSGSQIVIRNIIGNQLVKKIIQKSRKTEIDLSGYSNGIYLLHIRKGDKNVIRKIVVE